MIINTKLYSYRLKDGMWGELTRLLCKKANYICSNCKKYFPYNRYLTVHHRYYIEDLDPWHYPSDTYQVLCINCHNSIDHSNIKRLKNPYKDEMLKKKFIVIDKLDNNYYDSSYLPYNKFFSIVFYGEIIDCGYKTRYDGGNGRFDYELIVRELNNNDNSYSRFRQNRVRESGYRSCLKIEDYINE